MVGLFSAGALPQEQLVLLRSDIARQIKSKLMYFGLLDANDDRLISEKFLKETCIVLLASLRQNIPQEIVFEKGISVDRYHHALEKHWWNAHGVLLKKTLR